MKEDLKKDLQAPLVLLVVAVGGVFLFGMMGLTYYSFFAPKYQAVERKIFEETPSYVQGKIQYLTRLQTQYKTEKDPDTKSAIASLIKMEASSLKEEYIPPTLKMFINSL